MTQKYMYPKIFVLGNWEFTATPTTTPTTLPTPPQETCGLPQTITPQKHSPTHEFLVF